MIPVTFVVADDSIPSGVDLEGVLVRVYSEDGTTFITEASTDVDGRLTLDLPDLTTYWVRFFKVGYAFDSRATISVDGGLLNSFDVEARNLTTHPSATDPNLCRVSGYLLNGSGVPTPNVTLYFMLTGKPRVVGGRAMLPSKVYATTDKNGKVSIDLVRNGVYDVWAAGTDDVVYRAVVPDYPNVDITDLLFPIVTTLELEAPSVTVPKGDSVSVGVLAELSSRVDIPYQLDGGDSVSLSSIIAISGGAPVTAYFKDDALFIIGQAVGTVTVTLSVRSNIFALRQPAADTLTASIAVTVT